MYDLIINRILTIIPKGKFVKIRLSSPQALYY